MAMRDPAPSPLDVLETTFRLLTTGPDPLALDGHTLGCGLPARPIPLDELRSILLHPSTSFPARDAALGELVRRAQTHGGAWTVGLAGVLLPGLRRVAGHLAREFPGDTADIDAEVLTGFLEALAKLHLHPGRRRIAAHLLWGAFNRASGCAAWNWRRLCGACRWTPPRRCRHRRPGTPTSCSPAPSATACSPPGRPS
jgi:hypothetical protein